MSAERNGFDEVAVGDVISAGPREVPGAEIVTYAKRYDPRPYHVSDLAGRESHFGGLVASGTHTLSLWNELRFEAEAGLDELAGVGLDEVRYPRPVRPGDRLSLRAECIAKQLSQSKPDRGTLTFRHEISNQNGEFVLSLLVQTIVAR